MVQIISLLNIPKLASIICEQAKLLNYLYVHGVVSYLLELIRSTLECKIIDSSFHWFSRVLFFSFKSEWADNNIDLKVAYIIMCLWLYHVTEKRPVT